MRDGEMSTAPQRLISGNCASICRKAKSLLDSGSLVFSGLGQARNHPLRRAERALISTCRAGQKERPDGLFTILDEPTTGLHFADIEKLLQVLMKAAERGHTVYVIEQHNLEMIKCA